MSLVGSLEDLGLGDILQIVSLSRKSGLLLLRSDEGDGRIFFREGLVQAAYVKGEPEDLRSLLLAGGFADPGGLDSAVESARVQGGSAEDAAAACSGLSEQRLEALRREHVERAVLRMFRWRVGEFSFEVRDDMDARDLPLALPHGINAQYLTMEATRLGDEHADPAAESEDAFVLSGEGAAREAPPAGSATGQEAHEELALATATRLAEEPDRAPPPPEPDPQDEAELPALRVGPPRSAAARLRVDPPPPAAQEPRIDPPPPAAQEPRIDPPPPAAQEPRVDPPPLAAQEPRVDPPPPARQPPVAPARPSAQKPRVAPPPPPPAAEPLALGPPEEREPRPTAQAEPEPSPAAAGPEPAPPVAESAPPPPASRAAPPARPAMLPLVVIDPDLPALEWVKSTLAGIFARIHIFQHSEGGIARIRQYLSRAEVPVVLVSTRAPGDSLTGATDVTELLGRLRAQAPRMPIVAMCETGAEVPPGVDAADALVTRPPAGALRDSKRSGLVQEAGEQLHATLRPWALPAEGALPKPPARPRLRRRAQAIDASLRSLKEMSERLRDRATRGEVLNLVLDFAAVHFRRVAMFMVREEDAVGIAQRGLPRAGGPDDERFLALRVPFGDSAWLRSVVETGESLRASPGNEGDRRLAALLGSRPPIEAFVAPIESGGRVAALLYGDNLPEATPIGDTTVLAIVLHEAGLALDRAVLERALAQADRAR